MSNNNKMMDDTSDQNSTPDNGKESEPSNKRISGRKTSSSKDTSNDVLYAKGAAAQTITNPGNLYFYQLCETRYDEYTKIDVTAHPDGRRAITKEIVDAVIANGGVFRTAGGGKLKYNQAIEKTRDRLRQIGKPKLRPRGFGEHDVVSVRGARVHLYPGNAKWHALVDGYVLSYFRDIVDADTGLYNVSKDTPRKPINLPKGKGGRFKKGTIIRSRPAYQNDISNEIISTIHERGGKFRDEGLREFTLKEAADKIHNRFKDLKRELVSGKRDFKPHDNDADAVKKGVCVPESAVSGSTVATKTTALSGTEIFRQRLGGFSAVKATVSTTRELRAYKRRESASRRKERASRPKKKRTRQSYDDDDGSFHSAMLRYDNMEDDDDEEDEVEEETNIDSDSSDMEAKKVKLEKAANDRLERAKRRRSGLAAPTPPKPVEKKVKKRRRSTYEKEEEVAPDPPLSEYELYRLEKIQRNQAKLRQLGL